MLVISRLLSITDWGSGLAPYPIRGLESLSKFEQSLMSFDFVTLVLGMGRMAHIFAVLASDNIFNRGKHTGERTN